MQKHKGELESIIVFAADLTHCHRTCLYTLPILYCLKSSIRMLTRYSLSIRPDISHVPIALFANETVCSPFGSIRVGNSPSCVSAESVCSSSSSELVTGSEEAEPMDSSESGKLAAHVDSGVTIRFGGRAVDDQQWRPTMVSLSLVSRQNPGRLLQEVL